MSEAEVRASRAQVRRSDRAVDDEAWIGDLLRRAPLGFFASSVEGQPFINSNLFVYDAMAQAIYFHTARKGRTRDNVADGAGVCFTVAEMGRLLPADTALEFSVEYSSVVVFGRARVITEQATATAALQKLLDKYFVHLTPGEDYRPPVLEELKRTSVFALDIESWSGKMKKVGDFPGAFSYPEPDEAASADKSVTARGLKVATWIRDGYELSSERARLDIDVVHQYLSEESYWARGRSRDVVARCMENSLCFGLYYDGSQVGFARVITDYTIFAYIADVFVLEGHRGQGLGKWLVEGILAHPELNRVQKWSLDTRDAQTLYEQFGFVVAEHGRHMGLRREDE